jgi:hypothetical protein
MTTATKCEPVIAFRDEVRKMLRNRPRPLTLPTLSTAVGVSERWLIMFEKGKIPNPGVVTVCTLKKYLEDYAQSL